MVSQAPRLWKQLLQQLDAAASSDCQLASEVVEALSDTVSSLYDQPIISKATWKKLVNEMQVGWWLAGKHCPR